MTARKTAASQYATAAMPHDQVPSSSAPLMSPSFTGPHLPLPVPEPEPVGALPQLPDHRRVPMFGRTLLRTPATTHAPEQEERSWWVSPWTKALLRVFVLAFLVLALALLVLASEVPFRWARKLLVLVWTIVGWVFSSR